MAGLFDGFFSSPLWMVAWPGILFSLVVPVVIVTVADRLIRRR
jgi:hypothetical protein